MYKILILCGATLLLLGGYLAWRLLAPVHFGEPFRNAAQVELSELVARPESFSDRTITVSGLVQRQCPATGCWFYFRTPEGRELRVELGDTVPGLPQRVGSRARVEGRLVRQGSAYLLVGTGVEFRRGKPEEGTVVKDQTAAVVEAAAKASTPMPDGYPVDFCVVSGERLGSMGEPALLNHEGRTVKFCCAGCEKSFKSDPNRYLRLLDQAAAQKR